MPAHKTPLYECHEKSGATLIDFGGTLLPVRYTSEREEHLTVRTSAGMFDVSHMGEFVVSGPQAESFLMTMLSNNVAKLVIGKAHYSLLLNDHGGIIDDLIVYRLGPDKFLLCVNAANINTDWTWLNEHVIPDVKIVDESPSTAQIAVQGPQALPLIATFFGIEAPDKFCFSHVMFKGHELLIAHTGYTGEAGVEIFGPPNAIVELWRELNEMGVKPCGLAARDSLRLEAGMLLHGTDMDNQTTPLEARIMFAVDIAKENFIGQKSIQKQLKTGPKKTLTGFVMEGPGLARHGYKICDDDREIGVVTSAAWPYANKPPFGLGYVDADKNKVGKKVKVEIRGKLVDAVLSGLSRLRAKK